MLAETNYYKERLEAAAAARNKLVIKQSKDSKFNHMRIIEFLHKYNSELQARGVPIDKRNVMVEIINFKAEYGDCLPQELDNYG